jgi:hypothetical protein
MLSRSTLTVLPLRMLTQVRMFWMGSASVPLWESTSNKSLEYTYDQTGGLAGVLLTGSSALPAVLPLAAVVLALDT